MKRRNYKCRCPKTRAEGGRFRMCSPCWDREMEKLGIKRKERVAK